MHLKCALSLNRMSDNISHCVLQICKHYKIISWVYSDNFVVMEKKYDDFPISYISLNTLLLPNGSLLMWQYTTQMMEIVPIDDILSYM